MMIVWDSSLQHLVYLPEMTLRISHANNGLINVAMKTIAKSYGLVPSR
jgi:hypothetical protein